jgi:sterol 3beta-glucosyltransferase
MICCSGFLVVSSKFICFWSKSFAFDDTKYRFPISELRSAQTTHVRQPGAYGLALGIKGQKDMIFKFPKKDIRDDAIRRITATIQPVLNQPLAVASPLTSPSKITFLPSPSPSRSSTSTTASTPTVSTHDSMSDALSPISRTSTFLKSHPIPLEIIPHLPVPLNLPPTGGTIASTHFVCLTIGSRGDVQPYIALAKGLQKRGHTVTIVTHEEYKDWVTGWGVGHRTAGGDPAALMKLSVEHTVWPPPALWLEMAEMGMLNRCSRRNSSRKV